MLSPRFVLARRVCRYLPPIVSQRLRALIYPLAAAIRDDTELVARAQTGSRLRLRTSDFHGYRFAIHGYFDWRNVAIALAVCSPGDTIVEVGANIGTETISFADVVGSTGRVYAFEPLPQNVAALNSSLQISRHGHVTVMPYAVGDECGTAAFVPPATRSSSGTGHLAGAGGQNSASTLPVRCVTLDSLAAEMGCPKLISIDVEGAEVSVLRGAKRLLAQAKPAVILEASRTNLRRAGSSLEALYREITGADYAVYRITRLGLARVDRDGLRCKYYNWLCVHSTKLEQARSASRLILACGLAPCLPRLNPLTRA